MILIAFVLAMLGNSGDMYLIRLPGIPCLPASEETLILFNPQQPVCAAIPETKGDTPWQESKK